MVRFRKQHAEQVKFPQQLESLLCKSCLEHFQAFVKQSCRRDVRQKLAVLANRLLNSGVNPEVEFGRKTNGAQHSNRVLAQAPVRIADKDESTAFDVFDSANVVPDAEVGNVVIKRVAGEVATPDVFVDRAIHIVAKNPALVIVLHIAVILRALSSRSERRNFDNLASEANVCEPESPANQAAIGKQRTHLLRVRIRRNIEILRVQTEQCITHATADKKSLESRLVQPVQHLERTPGNFVPGYVVGGARNNGGAGFLL